MIDIPSQRGRLVEATPDPGPGQRAGRRLLHPAARLPGLRRDGPQPHPVPGQRVDRRLALGHLPRGRGGGQRRVDEDHFVAAPRPQRGPDRGQGHRDVRELVAGQGGGASRPATTRPSCSPPTATSASAPARTSSSSARAGCSPRRAPTRAPSRASPSSRSRRSPATSATRSTTSSSSAPTSIRPTRRSSPGPPPRWCRSGPSTTAGRAPASRARSPRRSSRPTSPPCAARSTSTRTGWTMSSDGPTLNDDSYATAGRCGPCPSARPRPHPQSRRRPGPHPSADPGPGGPCHAAVGARTTDGGPTGAGGGGTTSIFPTCPTRSTSSTRRSATAHSRRACR